MREQWARRIALLTGLLILFLTVAFAFIQNSTAPPDTTESGDQVQPAEHLEPVILDPQRIEAGRQVYKQQNCARCHSIAGKGNPRNPLDDVGARRTAEELRDWIIGADTLQGALAERAFKLKQAYREFSADDLDALVIYMQSLLPEINRTMQTEPVVEPTVVPVGENGNCLVCHGNAGYLIQVVKPPAARWEDGCAVVLCHLFKGYSRNDVLFYFGVAG